MTSQKEPHLTYWNALLRWRWCFVVCKTCCQLSGAVPRSVLKFTSMAPQLFAYRITSAFPLSKCTSQNTNDIINIQLEWQWFSCFPWHSIYHSMWCMECQVWHGIQLQVVATAVSGVPRQWCTFGVVYHSGTLRTPWWNCYRTATASELLWLCRNVTGGAFQTNTNLANHRHCTRLLADCQWRCRWRCGLGRLRNTRSLTKTIPRDRRKLIKLMLRKWTFLPPRSHLIRQFIKRHLVTLRREQYVLAQWLRQYFCQDHGVRSVPLWVSYLLHPSL